MYSTPADLSCCTNSAPPEPCTSRMADAGAAVESDCAIALTATVLIPSAESPVISLRREMPLSRYCLMRSFIDVLPGPRWLSSLLSSPRRRGPIATNAIVVVSCAASLCCGVPACAGTTEYQPVIAEPTASSNRARRDVHGQREQRRIEHERHHAVAEHGAADRPAADGD